MLSTCQKSENEQLTTLFSQNRTLRDENICVALPYVPQDTNKIKTIYRSYGMDIVYTNQNKIMNWLGSTKDKTSDLEKSGIYAIACTECDDVYNGQTKRGVETRSKERGTYIRNGYLLWQRTH